ncbi:MAG: RNA polymerase sigma-70 factor [Flavitalea sp.]
MTINALEEETIILQRLQAGDESSFAHIYRHYYSSVNSQVLHLMHSPELSEDITQEIFLKIWESREKLNGIRSFKSYLFITARNHTLNALKRAARSEAGMSEIIRHFELIRNTTEDLALSNEYLRFIQQKIDELPPRSREIFRLCREQSKSYDEVAAALGISRDAVKSRMVHAMKMLSDAAEKEMGLPLSVVLLLIARL